MLTEKGLFKVTLLLVDDTTNTRVLTGPHDSTIQDCQRILELVAETYGIKDVVSIEPVAKRTTFGFLHDIQKRLPDGRMATVTGWYY